MIHINASYIYDQAVVYAHSSYFYFGGDGRPIVNDKPATRSVELSIIARLDGSSYKWSKVGELNEARESHNAIQLNGQFLVAGGRDTYKTERCTYNNNKMVCHSQSPSLEWYVSTPEFMTVSDDYCD